MKRDPLGFVFVLPALCFAEKDVEEIFQQAKTCTAFIETRIEIPFIEDEQSTFTGADGQ